MKLMNGDCLELMKDIPDGSVDMVLCDLPYGVTECKWDKIIDPEKLWAEYRRIITNTGAVALFGQEPFSTKMRVPALDLYKYDWIWKKNTCSGFTHAKNAPLKNCELISIFSPGAILHKTRPGTRMTYNPQGLVYSPRVLCGIQGKGAGSVGYRPSQKERYVSEYTNYPKQLLEFDTIPTFQKTNPSQKPVPLLEYLIRTYTNPGETVLDNCMGSGSTGVACVNTGRKFIGIEKNDHYYEVACERIREAEEKKELAYTE